MYLSFDIGITNLAFVLVDAVEYLEGRDSDVKTLYVDKVDLSNINHKRIPYKQCKLGHSNQISDKVDHFLQEYEPVWAEFGKIDEVFLEIQPPTGIGSVEALLFKHYRLKVKQLSSVSMHKWLQISHLDYDARKMKITEFADPYLNVFTSYRYHERKHDMADAFCLCKFELQRRRKIIQNNQQQISSLIGKQTLQDYFEKYRFSQNPKNRKRKLSCFLSAENTL